MSLEAFVKPFAPLVLSLVSLAFASPQGVTPDQVSDRNDPSYVLTPVNQILIQAARAPKFNHHFFQIQPDGVVILPYLGRIQAAGLKTSELEKIVAARLKLKRKMSEEPAVTIFVLQLVR
jgi:protein involved in polysaccharide export with SLBB domain